MKIRKFRKFQLNRKKKSMKNQWKKKKIDVENK